MYILDPMPGYRQHIALNDAIASNLIAFTWSPKPSVYFRQYKPLKQHNSCAPYLRKLYECCDEFTIYPELNSNGNVHYHMTLFISNYNKWDRQVLPYFKTYGFTYVDKRVNEGWQVYMTKDVERFKTSFKPLVLPITEKNLGKLTQTFETPHTIKDYFDKIISTDSVL